MISSRRLAPLLHRAQERQTAAARQLAERQRLLAVHEARLGELGRYADDYGTRPPATANAAQLHGQRAFLGRVFTALEQQRQTVSDTHHTVEHGREHWRNAYRTTQVLEHLSERSHAAERAQAQRREQRNLDEFSTRLFAQTMRIKPLPLRGRGGDACEPLARVTSERPACFTGPERGEGQHARVISHHEVVS